MSGMITATILSIFTFIYSASAHNQDPPTIRKTMLAVYAEINEPLPKDYVKSKTTQNIDGRAVEIYRVNTPDGKVKAMVGKIEVQEILYAIAVDTDGKILAVSKRGKKLNLEEAKSLNFVEPTAKGLTELAKKG